MYNSSSRSSNYDYNKTGGVYTAKVSKVLDVCDVSRTIFALDKMPFLRRNLTLRTRRKKQQHKQQLTEPQQEILFLDLTVDCSNVHVVKTYAMFDCECPFCGCQKKDENALLKHCRRFHGDHHSFSSSRRENGTFSIVAHPIQLKHIDIDSVRDYQLFRTSSFKPPCEDIVFDKKRRVKPLTIDFASKPLFYRRRPPGLRDPLRQYYHSISRIPMEPDGWDVDSDDASSDGWIDDLGESCLKEFVDVSEPEKKFINLWKRFIRSNTILADGDVPFKCIEFIRVHASELIGLRMQCIMHLLTLWEYQLIPSSHIVKCMEEYDVTVGSLDAEEKQEEASVGDVEMAAD